MKKELIKDKNQVLVLILRNGDFFQGLNFYTNNKDFVQVSTWHYQKDKQTAPHAHKIVERIANRTQEVIYVKTGKIKAQIYTDDDKLCQETILQTGDIAIILAGGHAYEILEDKTQVLEIKNGPYPGLEKDKKVIEK